MNFDDAVKDVPISLEVGGRSARPDVDPYTEFFKIARANGLQGLCDALGFCGLRDDLFQMCPNGLTILAPTDNAFAKISSTARSNADLVRDLLFSHICPETFTLNDLQTKNCAVTISGQTHALYIDNGSIHVGTAQISRQDIHFPGGVIHVLDSVMVTLIMARDAHAEQVWKKSLKPAPIIHLIGGTNIRGAELELHGCLLHAATGQLVPDALRGHIRHIGSVLSSGLLINFSDLSIIIKPPSIARKRREQEGMHTDYRLLFSLWNASLLAYVSWQPMVTSLVVRNSFHMLPPEEKEFRRQQYSRTKNKTTKADESDMSLRTSQDESTEPVLADEEKQPQPTDLSTKTKEATYGPSSEATLEHDEAEVDLNGVASPQEPAHWLPLSKARDFQRMRSTTLTSEASDADESFSLSNSVNNPSPMQLGRAGPNFSAIKTEAELGSLDELMTRSPTSQSNNDNPILRELSCVEGPFEGGSPVWLIGDNFSPKMRVLFGDLPAAGVRFVSRQLIKCFSPTCMLAAGKHVVGVRVEPLARESQSSPQNPREMCRQIPFAYVQSTPPHVVQTEIIDRLLTSAGRVQAAAIALDSKAAAEGHTTKFANVFDVVDEHGYSFTEYARQLRHIMSKVAPRRSSNKEFEEQNASDLQLQHTELSVHRRRESLSMQLEKRPKLETLIERNILPKVDPKLGDNASK